MTAPRIPLLEQINAVVAAIKALNERDMALVEVGRMARADADARLAPLNAALTTMLWVQVNQKDFVALAQAKKRLHEEQMKAASMGDDDSGDGPDTAAEGRG